MFARASLMLLALIPGCEASVPTPPDAAEAVPAVEPLGMLRVRDDRKLILRTGGVGKLPGGAEIVDAAGLPLPPERLASPLSEGARIELGAGGTFVLTRIADEPLRWIRPAHGRDEVKRREHEIEVELARLPPRAREWVRPMKHLLAVVSVTEGSFDSVATHAGDPAASVGLFQWATVRRATFEDGASLARFFTELKARARDCADGEAQAFYCSAWAQCRAAGLDVNRGHLTWKGRAATGDELERVLAPVMGVPPLRTYQLIAAKDLVDRILAPTVKAGDRTGTISALLPEPRVQATVILLGVNRPAWVIPVVERAMAEANPDDPERFVYALRREALARYRPAEREARAMRLLVPEGMW